MELSPIWKDTFLQILREELIPAMGCTEPIAIAYGAARARDSQPPRPARARRTCRRADTSRTRDSSACTRARQAPSSLGSNRPA